MRMRDATHVTLLAAMLATLAGPATAQNVTQVPLSTHGGRMVVPVEAADGTHLEFLISTGSAVTVLSESASAKVGDQDLTLGGLPVNRDGMQTIADASLRVDGKQMDGLVSTNTLNDYDVLFDVPNGHMLLKPFGKTVEWPGVQLSDPVRLRVYHGIVLALDVEVDGTTYPAMLELGAPTLLSNKAVLEENHITDAKADLRLGATTLPGLPIQVSDHPSIARFSPNGDGFVLVGAAPAMTCAIAVSWVHREMRTCVR